MYECGIVEEVNFVNPAPKSFTVNQASFAAEQKRVAEIDLLKDIRVTVGSQFFAQIFQRLLVKSSLL